MSNRNQNLIKHRKMRPYRHYESKPKCNKTNILKEKDCSIKELLMGICTQSNEDKLQYIKAFIELGKTIKGNFKSLGYSTKDVLICLRVALVHPASQIRTAGLKAIKHSIVLESNILDFNQLLIPYLLTRCLDLSLKNEPERLEAMKLIRKVLLLSPINFHPCLSRCLVSLAIGGVEEKDRMLRICLATLCELGVLNPELFIETRGVVALTRNLLECQTPKIAESLCGVLLHLLNKPATRYNAKVDLLPVATPYCDFHYKHIWKDKNRDERDLRFNCSRLAMLSILRSWPGILHFCHPDNKSGLKAIVDILYLKQLDVRKAVLDLLYELLGLPQPEWTDELSVALSAVDPCEPQASWRLNEGFVVAEGCSVLPHLAKSTPRIIDMHLAILLYCFYSNGLINALVEVIITSDTFISVRATVLLGELLRLVQIILPPECCNTSPALPTLLEYATKNVPQAIGAVTALVKFHKLLKKRPASYSLYLDYILKSGNYLKLSLKKNKLMSYQKSRSLKNKIHQFVANTNNDIIKETGVLIHKDPLQWNWSLISIIVKGESGLKVTMTDTSHRTFFKLLIDFYIPSNNKYSHMDLSASKVCLAYTMVGIELFQFLLELNDNEALRLVTDLFRDILCHIKAITGGKSVHDCLFSPQHMVNTQCQNYFLFIGRIATTEAGVNLLNQIGMFQHLQNLATTTNNDCYVKLIVSSMDYSVCTVSRKILAAILTCNTDSSRLYATQFLLILLRSGTPNFESWGIQLLVKQLEDKSKIISLSALSIINEACEASLCLEVLVNLPIDYSSLGENGKLLLTRILSTENGFNKFNKNNQISDEIKHWDNYMVYRYVNLVDDQTSTALTLHQRGDDGKYIKRLTSTRLSNAKREYYLPPHLYGQLTQHTLGLKALNEHSSLHKYIQILENGICDTDNQVLELKASIWCIAHFSTSSESLKILLSSDILSNLVNLAEKCEVYSVRATAYYALCLVGTTQFGAEALNKMGWVCTKHNRHEIWPVNCDKDSEIFSDSEDDSESDSFLEYSFSESPKFKDRNKISKDSSFPIYHPGYSSFSEKHMSTWKKSSTLPIHQNFSSSFHKRSLSESKTFETLKNYEQKLKERVGLTKQNSNYSNASTSAMEDEYSSKKISLGTPLSPISSSSNLNFSRNNSSKLRRHSESCRRETNSLSESNNRQQQTNTTNLRTQDLLGYTTLHYIRKRNTSSSDADAENVCGTSNPFIHLIKPSMNTYVDNYISQSSLSSLSSINKFNVNDKQKTKRPCFMGISLPRKLIDIFPAENLNESLKQSISDNDSLTSQYSLSLDSQSLKPNKSSKEFLHDTKNCLECMNKENILENCESSSLSLENDLKKMDILHHLIMLANPISDKFTILKAKQENARLFEDVCLYSEACKLLSNNYYRLNTRRIIHELFYDLNYILLLQIAIQIITTKNLPNLEPCESTDMKEYEIKDEIDSASKPTESISSLKKSLSNTSTKSSSNVSCLKLSYKENKFPIKHRNI